MVKNMHFVTHNYALLTTGPSAFVFVVTTVVEPERLQSKARLWYKSLRQNIHLSRSSLPQTETISIQILSTPVATLPARNHSQSCRNGEKHAFCDTQLRLVNHGSQRFRVRCNHSGRAGEVAITPALGILGVVHAHIGSHVYLSHMEGARCRKQRQFLSKF